MAELANCTRCGNVFAKNKNIRDICPACVKEEEADFNTVYRFLKEQKNQKATLQEIVRETDVSEDIIITFIKNKRLRTSQFPNLAYPCERCRAPIVSGRVCEGCSKQVMADLDLHVREESKQSDEKKADVYYSIERRNL